MWSINIELLCEKSGGRSKLPGFQQKLKAIIEADALPDYRISFDKNNENLVLFVTRDINKVVTRMLKQSGDNLKS